MTRHSRDRTSLRQRDSRRQRRLTFERLETRELLSVVPPAPPLLHHAASSVPTVPSLTPTQLYIKNFSPAYYIQQGTSYTNFAYTPAGAAQRVGKPASQINDIKDYDFAELAAVTNELAGVNRLQALQAIFAKITVGAKTDEAKQLAVLLFLQEAHVHNPLIMPVYSNGTMVTDPLVLLQLGEMRCGQVARVAVDLFSSVGYQARLDQLGGHAIAEIYYGGNWHYFDADLFGGGECVFNPDGSIPSVAQLSENPYLIDSLPSYWAPNCYNSAPTAAQSCPSYNYFSLQAWDAEFPAGKAPTPERRLQDGNPRPGGELHLLRLGVRQRRGRAGPEAL